MSDRRNILRKLAIQFLLLAVLSMVVFGGAVGGPKHFAGEFEPNTYSNYTVEFAPRENVEITVEFSPKYQKERSKEECEKFQLKLYDANGDWFMTTGGILKYVEENNSETLRCFAYGGYGSANRMASQKKYQTITIQVINNNIWKGKYNIDTN